MTRRSLRRACWVILFMMGDNRDNSLDSRVPADDGGVGFVPAENCRPRRVRGRLLRLPERTCDLDWVTDFRLSRFFNGGSRAGALASSSLPLFAISNSFAQRRERLGPFVKLVE